MKKFLASKAGVTVLEGIIALGLLALITGGAFSILLASSRQTTQPDVREEMVWAVENARDQLKAVSYRLDAGLMEQGSLALSNESDLLCGTLNGNALQAGKTAYNIRCLLPVVCDRSNSSFTFLVSANGAARFNITCNGYEL